MRHSNAPGKRADRDHDLIVLGAGSAGFSASIAASERDARVALVGQGTLGGTCVNVGCVPSKAIIRAAEAVQQANTVDRFSGLCGQARVVDWRATLAQKDELVAHLRESKYSDVLSAYPGIEYFEGSARLTPDGAVVDDIRLRAPAVVVATGARPAIPPVPGIEAGGYLTSTSLLSIPALPSSLIVLGGGFIAVELAQALSRLGVTVTLACRSRLLSSAEPEVSDALAVHLTDEGISIFANSSDYTVDWNTEGVTLGMTDAQGHRRIHAERLLVATGRTPNVDGLGLVGTGIAQDDNGAIIVDDRMRTTRPGVYAAGDVTQRQPFVYMAAHGGRIAALNALDGDTHRYDDSVVPWVVFTDPQAAGVGYTEHAARRMGLAVRTSIVALSSLPRALVARDTRGLIKLVVDASNDHLLGAHLLAPDGGDSIQTAAMALRHRMTTSDLVNTIFPYLTTVEGLKLAALAIDRNLDHLSCCAG